MFGSSFFSRLKASANGNPGGLYVLLSAEVPELMGRFGIMATLVLYMTTSLHVSDAFAFTVYSSYLMMSYITPILGGYLADRFLGYRWSAIFGSILMIVGDVFLMSPTLISIYIGLSLMAVGIGFFSPSLIALVNALYADKDDGREQAFVLYYIARNVGALISPTVCGFLGVAYGYNYAFLFTGIAMAVGLIIFLLGYNSLPKEDLKHVKSRGIAICIPVVVTAILIPIIIFAFKFDLSVIFLMLGLVVAIVLFIYLFKISSSAQKISLVFILLSIVVIMVFLSVDQLCGASFNLFVERLIDRSVFSYELPTSVFFSINPLFMIIFGGFIMAFVNKIKKPDEITAAFIKYILAFFIFAVAIFILVLAAVHATFFGVASGLYIVFSYALCALAELCIVPIVIALIGRLAPIGKVGLMMGLYQFGDAIASYATGKIAGSATITFSLNSAHALQRAAFIYRDLFFKITIILLIVGCLLILLRYIVRMLVLRQSSLPSC